MAVNIKHANPVYEIEKRNKEHIIESLFQN